MWPKTTSEENIKYVRKEMCTDKKQCGNRRLGKEERDVEALRPMFFQAVFWRGYKWITFPTPQRFFGAEARIWTGTSVHPLDPEPSASTNSATSAQGLSTLRFNPLSSKIELEFNAINAMVSWKAQTVRTSMQDVREAPVDAPHNRRKEEATIWKSSRGLETYPRNSGIPLQP